MTELEDQAGAEVALDNEAVRSAAARMVADNRRARVVEVLLVLLAVLALVILGQRISSLAQTNRRGVDRIVSCTTPGHPCYEESRARTDLLLTDALLRLNQEHLVIECILNELPERRTQATEDACRVEAAAETERLRAQAAERAKAARAEAERKNGAPKP